MTTADFAQIIVKRYADEITNAEDYIHSLRRNLTTLEGTLTDVYPERGYFDTSALSLLGRLESLSTLRSTLANILGHEGADKVAERLRKADEPRAEAASDGMADLINNLIKEN